jgi:hypothetical protein
VAVIRRIRGVLFLPAAASIVIAALVSATPAWAGGPGGVVETGDSSRAVGSGVLNGTLIGFTASGATNDDASAAVIAICQSAGADQCSRDEVTDGVFCVVSVGADDGSGIVAGGAGATVETAREDAYRNVGRANLVLAPDARILASSCL